VKKKRTRKPRVTRFELKYEQALAELLVAQAQIAALTQDRHRYAALLTTFYRAPRLSISSLRPLLDLADELNPLLRQEKRP
jgi:hypothetical protein